MSLILKFKRNNTLIVRPFTFNNLLLSLHKTNTKLYADDTNLLMNAENVNKLQDKTNYTMCSLNLWQIKKKLINNTEKLFRLFLNSFFNYK